jgi:outer membrane protein assembly factor BamB
MPVKTTYQKTAIARGDRSYVADAAEGTVAAFDKDGRLVWELQDKRAFSTLQGGRPVLDFFPEYIHVGDPQGIPCLKVDPATGKAIWSAYRTGTKYQKATIARGERVYVADAAEGTVAAFDKHGLLVWEVQDKKAFSFLRDGRGPVLTLFQGNIRIGDVQRHPFLEVDPATGKVLWSTYGTGK